MITNLTDEHWSTFAACGGVDDPEIFFPLVYAQSTVVQVAEAKAVCNRCISKTRCLAWALRVGEPDGIWGGTTPDERRAIRYRQRKLAEVAAA